MCLPLNLFSRSSLMQHRRALLLASATLLLASACSSRRATVQTFHRDKVYPAGGKVYLRDKPLVMGIIEIFPVTAGQGNEGRGVIGPDGTFVLRTFSNSSVPDGAVPGKYHVAVRTFNESEGGPLPKGVKPTPVSEKYDEPRASGLFFEIKAEDNRNLEVHLPD